MTKEELIEALRQIDSGTYVYHRQDGRVEDYTDAEDWHIKADELLCEYINDSEVTAAFDAIEKWYA